MSSRAASKRAKAESAGGLPPCSGSMISSTITDAPASRTRWMNSCSIPHGRSHSLALSAPANPPVPTIIRLSGSSRSSARCRTSNAQRSKPAVHAVTGRRSPPRMAKVSKAARPPPALTAKKLDFRRRVRRDAAASSFSSKRRTAFLSRLLANGHFRSQAGFPAGITFRGREYLTLLPRPRRCNDYGRKARGGPLRALFGIPTPAPAGRRRPEPLDGVPWSTTQQPERRRSSDYA